MSKRLWNAIMVVGAIYALLTILQMRNANAEDVMDHTMTVTPIEFNTTFQISERVVYDTLGEGKFKMWEMVNSKNKVRFWSPKHDKLGEHIYTEHGKCNVKALIARDMILNRPDKSQAYWLDMIKVTEAPHIVRMDLQRMTRDVYRKDRDVNTFPINEYVDCMRDKFKVLSKVF